jgi:hypothetical protein
MITCCLSDSPSIRTGGIGGLPDIHREHRLSRTKNAEHSSRKFLGWWGENEGGRVSRLPPSGGVGGGAPPYVRIGSLEPVPVG